MGSRLAREGFPVGNIANHKDFSLEKTIIAYRTEAARVAQVLCQKFFLEAIFQEEDTLPPWVDVRVSLGRDLNSDHRHIMARAFPGEALP